MLLTRVGDATSQQAAEALMFMAALRLWSPERKDRRITSCVRADSVIALTLLMYNRARGPTITLIACVTALVIAEAILRPGVAAYRPGSINKAANASSRPFARAAQ